jgi:beta-glucosidase
VFLRFPDGFLWGAGGSAHQVEGGNTANDWWAFEQRGCLEGGVVSGDAADEWNRYHEDYALAAELGHNAHKLSVEWSRIEPQPGVYDEAALAHYAEVLTTLRALGLKTFVTLHHFTSPLWMAAAGTWEHAQAAPRFAAYCEVVAGRLGHLVDAWITINEPMLVAVLGYVEGTWPPERKSFRSGRRVARNLMRAHRLAYEAVKRVKPDAVVGIAVNATVFELSTRGTFGERLLLAPLDWAANLWYLDRVRDRLDFIGLQYYSRATVSGVVFGDPTIATLGEPLPVSDLGWAIYPQGLHNITRRTWHRYKLPIYITENGIADATDVQRKAFIHDHLRCLHEAIAEGADVRGYFHWSLIDNMEWLQGFWPRFGLIEVDYATQQRRVRDSARYYATICRANGVEVVPKAAKPRLP